MLRYTVHLDVDQSILKLRSKDNLCIARKVNDVFTTVFQGASLGAIGHQQTLRSKNDFSWSDEFRVFCVLDFAPLNVVSATTDIEDINYGEECLYEDGFLDHATSALVEKFPGGDQGTRSAVDSFIIGQVPQSLRAGCACRTVNERWDPVYVDPEVHFGARDQRITPSNDYVIFWDSLLTPNVMFRYAPTLDKKVFSLTATANEISLRYGYAKPDEPTAGESARFYKRVGSQGMSGRDQQPQWVKM